MKKQAAEVVVKVDEFKYSGLTMQSDSTQER